MHHPYFSIIHHSQQRQVSRNHYITSDSIEGCQILPQRLDVVTHLNGVISLTLPAGG